MSTNRSIVRAFHLPAYCLMFIVFVHIAFAQGTITHYVRTQFSGTYAGINGSNGPSGDDNAMNYSLPFVFRYDGADYTQIRICTNGWVELGSPAHPLSTTATTSNYSLFTTEFPLNAIAPWWDDLSTGSGSIQYATVGASPNRVFAVEWKNVNAYFSGNGRAITFQLRLYESSGIVELWYGSAIGVSSSSESASFGIKDSVGGPGHFIDGSTGSTTIGVTNLNTAQNWPATFYRFSPKPINLLRPNGGEYFFVGLTDTIRWQTDQGRNLTLAYSTDAGDSWLTIGQVSASASVGSYPWVVPNTPTHQGLVRISDATDTTKFIVSDTVFTIQLLPAITVSPDSFVISLAEGDSTQRTLNLGNMGTGDLEFQINFMPFQYQQALPSRTQALPLKLREAARAATSPITAPAPETRFTVQNFPTDEETMHKGDDATQRSFVPEFGKRIYQSDRLNQTPQNILVLEDVPSSVYNYDLALNNLGLSRTVVAGRSQFMVALNSDIHWDLIIVDSYDYQNLVPVLGLLDAFQATGGRLLYADGYLSSASSHLLLEHMGIRYVSTFATPKNIFAIDTLSPIFNSPNIVRNLPWSYNIGNTCGEIVDVLEGATQVAAFEGYPSSGAIVVNSTRRCIFNGFEDIIFTGDENQNGKADIVELFENEITYLLGVPGVVTADPAAGIVTPGGSSTITFTLRTPGLTPGVYSGDMMVRSNDPLKGTFTIPVTVTVAGNPHIVVVPESLDFGPSLVHRDKIDTVLIQNVGSAELYIDSIGASNSAFLPNLTFAILPPHTQQTMLVKFSPQDTGSFAGSIVLAGNDSLRPLLHVAVRGYGEYPPNVRMVPDSFVVSVPEGDSLTSTLTMENLGQGPVTFTLTHTYLPAENPGMNLAQSLPGTLQQPALTASGNKVVLWDLTHASGTSYGPSGEFFSIANMLDSMGYRNETTVSGLNTLDLSHYALIVINLGGADLSPYTSAEASALRSFVGSGGGVLIMGDNPNATNANINPVAQAFGVQCGVSNIVPDYLYLTPSIRHPLFDGVSLINFLAAGEVTAQPPSRLVLSDTTGKGVVAVAEVGLGKVVVTGDVSMWIDYYIGSVDNRLFAKRTLQWLTSPTEQWLSEHPAGGTLNPSERQDVAITCRAANLPVGDYRANILFADVNPQVHPSAIPVHMHVSGKPVIALMPDSLSFGDGFIGFGRVDTLMVQNSGSDALTVTITGDNPVFHFNLNNFTVPPHTGQAVRVTFTAVDTGQYEGALRIASNDTSRPLLTVPLSGHGVYPPSMTVTPDSIGVALAEGDSTVRTMTIGNAGRGILHWNIEGTGGAAGGSGVMPGLVDRLNPSVDRAALGKHGIDDDASRQQPAASMKESGQRCFHATTGTEGIPILLWSSIYNAPYWSTFVSTLQSAGCSVTQTDVRPIVPEQHYAAIFLCEPLTVLTNNEIASLVNYVNQGGRVIEMTDSYPENVNPFLQYYGVTRVASSEIGTAVYSHSLFDNVGQLTVDGDSWDNTLTVASPSHAIATVYGSNIVSLADNGRVLVLGEDSEFSDYVQALSDPDNAQLLANVIRWIKIGTADWFSATPTSGTVDPSATQSVALHFRAGQREPGDYQANMTIASDDPQQPAKHVPLSLHISGKPVILVHPDSMAFGNGCIGFNTVDTLIVENAGSDVLTVSSITSDNPVFHANRTYFTVPSHDSTIVLVTFAAADTIGYAGALHIAGNDTSRPSVTVPLTGHGVYPPNMTVTPDSIRVSLAEGDSTARSMTIGNVGRGILHWNIAGTGRAASGFGLLPGIADRPNRSISGNTPVTQGASADVNVKSAKNLSVIGQKYFPSTAGIENIPILFWCGSDNAPSMTTFITTLQAADFTVTETDVRPIVPQQQYAAIFICEPPSLLTNSEVTALVNYVNAGGRVIEMTDSYLYNVNPFLQYYGVTRVASPVSGTAVYSHSLFDSVGQLTVDGGDWDNTLTVTSPSRAIATINGMTIVSLSDNGRVLVFGEDTEFSEFEQSMSDPDNVQLLANVIRWIKAGHADWFSVTPTSGVVNPSATQNISVEFRAGDLAIGEYHADFSIAGDDPGHPTKRIPLSLHIIGKPVIVVKPTVLSFNEGYIGYPTTDTLTVKNSGTELLTVSNITSSNSAFHLNRTSFSVQQHDSAVVLVTFQPADTLTYTGTLTIANNDSVTPAMNVGLSGRGMYPPVLQVTPDSFLVTLHGGDSTSRTVTIGNTGQGVLHWSISGSPRTVTSLGKTFSGPLSVPTPNPANTPPSSSECDIVPPLSANSGASDAGKFADNFETGVLNPVWVPDSSRSHVSNVTPATAANGSHYSFTQTRVLGNYGHYDGVHATFAPIRPNNVSFWVRIGSGMSDSTQAAGYFVLGDSAIRSNQGAFFFLATGNGKFVLAPVDQSFQYTVNSWYHIEFRNIDWSTKSFNYYVNDVLIRGHLSFRASTTQDFSSLYLYNFSGNIQAWWDEIRVGDWDLSWLSFTPASGNLAPNATQDITAHFTPRDLPAGDYDVNLVLHTNDPLHKTKFVPMRLQMIVLDVADHPAGIPGDYLLEQNYPNPFNPTTTIRYQLPMESRVTLKVYTVLGEEVASLQEGVQGAGYKAASWEGVSLASGMYFYRLDAVSVSDPAKRFTQVRKMLLIR